MITPRMRRRRRLLDTYVRVELEERGMLRDDRAEHPRLEPSRPRPKTNEENLGAGEDARDDRPA